MGRSNIEDCERAHIEQQRNKCLSHVSTGSRLPPFIPSPPPALQRTVVPAHSHAATHALRTVVTNLLHLLGPVGGLLDELRLVACHRRRLLCVQLLQLGLALLPAAWHEKARRKRRGRRRGRWDGKRRRRVEEERERGGKVEWANRVKRPVCPSLVCHAKIEGRARNKTREKVMGSDQLRTRPWRIAPCTQAPWRG